VNRTPLNPALHRDQEQMLARANRSAAAVDRLILAAWRRLVDAVLRSGEDASHWPIAYRAARAAIEALPATRTSGRSKRQSIIFQPSTSSPRPA